MQKIWARITVDGKIIQGTIRFSIISPGLDYVEITKEQFQKGNIN